MNLNNNKKKYRFLADVALADICYEAYGKNLNEVFENCALAIFELSAEISTVKAKQRLEIEIEHEKLDNLLYDFLSEILYLKDAKYVVFKKVKVKITQAKKENEKNKLNAVLYGDTIDSETQKLENDIKAITMHMFYLKKEKNNWKARVVVDI